MSAFSAFTEEDVDQQAAQLQQSPIHLPFPGPPPVPTQLVTPSPKSKAAALVRSTGHSPSAMAPVVRALATGYATHKSLRTFSKRGGRDAAAVARAVSGPPVSQSRLSVEVGRECGVDPRRLQRLARNPPTSLIRDITQASFDPQRKAVCKFLDRDDVSVISNRRRDTIWVKRGGGKERVPRRTLVDREKHLSDKYNSEQPAAMRVSYEEFTRIIACRKHLRRLDNKSRDYCLCLYHETPQYMLQTLNQNQFVDTSELNTAAAKLMCQPEDARTRECHMRTCEKCNSPHHGLLGPPAFSAAKLDKVLKWRVWKDIAEEVNGKKFTKWLPAEEQGSAAFLLDKLCTNLSTKYIRHEFLRQQVMTALCSLHDNLPQGHHIWNFDFAQKYVCSNKRSNQSLYFSAPSIELHTMAIRYRSEDGEMVHRSFVLVSDETAQNNLQVFAYLKFLHRLLEAEGNKPTHVHHVTDGCGKQYKSVKAMKEIVDYLKDFGCSCDWTYHVTSHGKCKCDAHGGKAKNEGEHGTNRGEIIMNAEQFAAVVNPRLPSISVLYVPPERFKEAEAALAGRFDGLKALPNTLGTHFVAANGKGGIFHTETPCFCDRCVVGDYCAQSCMKQWSFGGKTVVNAGDESGDEYDDADGFADPRWLLRRSAVVLRTGMA